MRNVDINLSFDYDPNDVSFKNLENLLCQFRSDLKHLRLHNLEYTINESFRDDDGGDLVPYCPHCDKAIGTLFKLKTVRTEEYK